MSTEIYGIDLPEPEPPNDIWDIWWEIPMDDPYLQGPRSPKVVISPDGKTFSLHNCPVHIIDPDFARKLAIYILAAAERIDPS